MRYIRKVSKYLLLLLFLVVSYNLYYIFLIPQSDPQSLIYIDIVLAVCVLLILFIDAYEFYKKERKKQELLLSEEIISSEMKEYENVDIAYHDERIYQQLLDEQIEMNHNLEDYIAKWCHEVKLPLSALMMMNEKNTSELKDQYKEQLEKINMYLNNALVGCKVQSNLYDIQIKKLCLQNCIHTAIKNSRYFLIKNHFDIQIENVDEEVYSDSEWLTYILDQLISNAIKYASDEPKLHIWCEKQQECVHLYFEDNGEGIRDTDLPRIFERGYTGSNHHNGLYKSTGMGLYMVKLMIDKLGHEIEVDSEFHHYTRFHITFRSNAKFFNL